MLEKLKKITRKLRHRLLHKPDVKLPYTIYGTEYGGWPLLDDTRKGAVIYSFGIGKDISFSLAAIDKLQCRVLGFDPTPKSMAWLERQELPKEFEFHPLGIAGKDGEVEFFAPTNPNFVSFSASPDPSGTQADKVTARVQRLESIVAELDEPAPDILKMDIEGFEYDVIEEIIAGPLRPRQFLVEFHHEMYGISKDKTLQAVDRLRDAGYRLFYLSDVGREYAFALI